MQKLNVRFTSKTKEAISEAAEANDLFDSMIARAAINIGLQQISNFDPRHEGNFYEWIEENQGK